MTSETPTPSYTAPYHPHQMERLYGYHLLETKFNFTPTNGIWGGLKEDDVDMIMISGRDAVPFLMTSGVERDVLRSIWAVADPDGIGTLTKRSQLYTILRLISLSQSSLLPPLVTTSSDPTTLLLETLQSTNKLEVSLPTFSSIVMPTTAHLIHTYSQKQQESSGDGGNGEGVFEMVINHDYQYNQWLQSQGGGGNVGGGGAPGIGPGGQLGGDMRMSVSDAFGGLIEVEDQPLPSISAPPPPQPQPAVVEDEVEEEDDFGDFEDAPTTNEEETTAVVTGTEKKRPLADSMISTSAVCTELDFEEDDDDFGDFEDAAAAPASSSTPVIIVEEVEEEENDDEEEVVKKEFVVGAEPPPVITAVDRGDSLDKMFDDNLPPPAKPAAPEISPVPEKEEGGWSLPSPDNLASITDKVDSSSLPPSPVPPTLSEPTAIEKEENGLSLLSPDNFGITADVNTASIPFPVVEEVTEDEVEAFSLPSPSNLLGKVDTDTSGLPPPPVSNNEELEKEDGGLSLPSPSAVLNTVSADTSALPPPPVNNAEETNEDRPSHNDNMLDFNTATTTPKNIMSSSMLMSSTEDTTSANRLSVFDSLVESDLQAQQPSLPPLGGEKEEEEEDFGDFADAAPEKEEEDDEDGFGDFTAVPEVETGKEEEEEDDFGDFADAQPTPPAVTIDAVETAEEKAPSSVADDTFGNFENTAATPTLVVENNAADDAELKQENKEEEGGLSLPSPDNLDTFGNFNDSATENKEDDKVKEGGEALQSPQQFNDNENSDFGAFETTAPPEVNQEEEEEGKSLPSPDDLHTPTENVVALPAPNPTLPQPEPKTTLQEEPHRLSIFDEMVETSGISSSFNQPLPPLESFGASVNNSMLMSTSAVCGDFDLDKVDDDDFGDFEGGGEGESGLAQVQEEKEEEGVLGGDDKEEDDWGDFEAVGHSTTPQNNDVVASNTVDVTAGATTTTTEENMLISVNQESDGPKEDASSNFGFGDFTETTSSKAEIKEETKAAGAVVSGGGFEDDDDWGDFDTALSTNKKEEEAANNSEKEDSFAAFDTTPTSADQDVENKDKEDEADGFAAFATATSAPLAMETAPAAALGQRTSTCGFDADWGDFETVQHEETASSTDKVEKQVSLSSPPPPPAATTEAVAAADNEDEFGDWGAFESNATPANGSNAAPSSSSFPTEQGIQNTCTSSSVTLESLRKRLIQATTDSIPKELELKTKSASKRSKKKNSSKTLYLAKFDEGTGANVDAISSGKWLPMEEHFKIDPNGAKERLQKAIRCVSLHEMLSSNNYNDLCSRWKKLITIVKNELMTAKLLLENFPNESSLTAQEKAYIHESNKLGTFILGLKECVRVVRSIVATIGDLLCLDKSIDLKRSNHKKDWGGIMLLEGALDVEDSFKTIGLFAEKFNLCSNSNNTYPAAAPPLESIQEIRKRTLQQQMEASMSYSLCYLTLQYVDSSIDHSSSRSSANDTRASVNWDGKTYMACAANFWCNKVSVSVP